MKNKHLVLLFLAVASLAWWGRKCSFQKHDAAFHKTILQMDTALVSQIEITRPGKQPLLLEKTGKRWLCTSQSNTTPVPPAIAAALLRVLQHVEATYLLPNSEKKAESLGFAPDRMLTIAIFEQEKCVDKLEIGADTVISGRKLTFARIHGNPEIFAVEGYLAQEFDLDPIAWRKREFCRFDPDKIASISLNWHEKAPVFLEKKSNENFWNAPGNTAHYPDAVIKNWLVVLQSIENSPFLDAFDISQESDNRYGKLELSGSQNLVLEGFIWTSHEWPEEQSTGSQHMGEATVYVVKSSQNEGNYFQIQADSVFYRIFNGPITEKGKR